MRLVGHNIAYDMGVIAQAYPDLLPAIFAAYDADRVTDTMLRQKLLDTASGDLGGFTAEGGVYFKTEYTLEATARRKANMRLQKDAWRLSYGAFIGVPLAEWPRVAREVQARGRVRLDAACREHVAATAAGDDALAKALDAEIKGLQEMVASDPSRCTEYPLDDARATLAVWQAQEVHAEWLHDQYRQARAYFALHLASAWGLRTDAVGVAKLREETQAEYEALEAELIDAGLIRADKKRSRDTKAAKRLMIEVCTREGFVVRRTDGHALPRGADPATTPCKCKGAEGAALAWVQDAKGHWVGHPDCYEHVSLDADACAATEDETLEAYAEITTCKKVLSNDVKAMQAGIEYPVHPSYGWAATGRTTCRKPNIQNVTKRPGIRECFVPRPGCVLFACDFPSLELYTLAQCCVTWLGMSRLAEALNAGLDPHTAMAATMLGYTYADAVAALERIDAGCALPGDQDVADFRALAKVANFGFPGGMGAKKLLASTRKSLNKDPKTRPLLARLDAKELLTLERMLWLRAQWQKTWPEMPAYFARINAQGEEPDGLGIVESLFTRRMRGKATYCARANNGFQGLGADCAKRAGYLLAVSEYVDTASPLYGARTVAMVHDEYIGEALEERAHDAAYACADVMRRGANELLPNVPIPASKMKPVLMRRWSKSAKQVFESGRLVPWVAKAA
jgi:DNA polymerase-1